MINLCIKSVLLVSFTLFALMSAAQHKVGGKVGPQGVDVTYEYSGCIAGDALVDTDLGAVLVRDLETIHHLRGLSGEWCQVLAVYPWGSSCNFFGNFTSNHIILDNGMAIPHGKRELSSRKATGFDILTTCPFVLGPQGIPFTPIASWVMPDNTLSLSEKEYTTLFFALLSLSSITGPIWFDPSSYRSRDEPIDWKNWRDHPINECDAEVCFTEWQWQMPQLIAALLRCTERLECAEFEARALLLVENSLKTSVAEVIKLALPKLGNPDFSKGSASYIVIQTVRQVPKN